MDGQLNYLRRNIPEIFKIDNINLIIKIKYSRIDRTINLPYPIYEFLIAEGEWQALLFSIIRYSLIATCVPHYYRYKDNRSHSNVQIAVCACIFHYGIAKPGDSRGKTIIHSSFVSRYYVNKRRKIFRKLLKNTLNCRKICKLKKNE